MKQSDYVNCGLWRTPKEGYTKGNMDNDDT